jgi:D-3-phosphoglycerate dehydrogenase
MAKPKVLISDKLSPRAVEIFKERGVDVDVKTSLTPEELLKIIGEYDGLAIRSATKVTKDVIKAGKKLKVVGRAGIGVDNVDIPAATAEGIVVMNTPFGNSVTTAEHAIAMMFSVARQIPQASSSTHAGKWEKSKFMGVELTGKVLGLIGCGNIGSIVADRAQGLKMKVVAYDPFLTAERAKDMNVEKVELPELLKRADFITLHTPLNDATRNILNEKSLKQTKKGVYIVNCARGGLIDEPALKKLLDEGHVAGAALDVFLEEPAKTNVLFGSEQVVCTPHLGASTNEAQENVALQVAEQMSDFLTAGAVTNAVNIPSLSAEDAKKLKPYLDLADQLGSFAGQITQSGLNKVKIEYQGRVAKLNTKPLTSALLRGLLAPMVETVNLVNAPVIAKDRNISISEVKNEQTSDYQTLITLTITTDRQERSLSGTLFSGKPRIVSIGDIKLEASLGKNMLYVNNEDKPGLIGNLGKLLGDAKINVANFHLGRGEKQGDAVALVETDQPVDGALLKKVSELPSVKLAKALSF